MKQIFTVVSRIILLIVALYFLRGTLKWTLRISNYFLIDSQSHLQLIYECDLTSDITVRRYVFHGSSATTSDSNSVYVQIGDFPFERSIWGAYSSPFIKDMKCSEEGLVIVTDSDDPALEVFNFSVEQIKTELVHNPIGLYKGRYETEEEINNKIVFDQTILICNIIPALITGLMVFGIKPTTLLRKIRNQ